MPDMMQQNKQKAIKQTIEYSGLQVQQFKNNAQLRNVAERQGATFRVEMNNQVAWATQEEMARFRSMENEGAHEPPAFQQKSRREVERMSKIKRKRYNQKLKDYKSAMEAFREKDSQFRMVHGGMSLKEREQKRAAGFIQYLKAMREVDPLAEEIPEDPETMYWLINDMTTVPNPYGMDKTVGEVRQHARMEAYGKASQAYVEMLQYSKDIKTNYDIPYKDTKAECTPEHAVHYYCSSNCEEINNRLRDIPIQNSTLKDTDAARITDMCDKTLDNIRTPYDMVVKRRVSYSAIKYMFNLPKDSPLSDEDLAQTALNTQLGKTKEQMGATVLHDKGFMSTSFYSDFDAYSNKIEFILKIPKGTHALGISGTEMDTYGEDELLLHRNSSLQLMKIEKVGNNKSKDRGSNPPHYIIYATVRQADSQGKKK